MARGAELGFVLNDLSLQDKLPTVFKPVRRRRISMAAPGNAWPG